MKEIILKAGSGESTIIVGEGLTDRLSDLSENIVLLVDENVMQLHAKKFESFRTIKISAGERNKSLHVVEDVFRELIKLEVDRTSMIIGVGGGLTTDISGFVASTYLRGIRFGFISTTLLGQVDASIGGKNGVNLDGYKNMIGVIMQPEFIWCDLDLLDTLEDKEYRAGIAEVIKYGAIWNPELLNFVDRHMVNLLNREKPVLEKIIGDCIEIKRDIVQNDERESGARRLLNFGHTVGHAIERNYQLLHGEAIAIGMVIAARLSAAKGFISEQETIQLQQVIEKAGLPVSTEIDAAALFNTVRKDKKKKGSDIHFIFLKSIGKAFAGEIELSELNKMLNDLCQHSE